MRGTRAGSSTCSLTRERDEHGLIDDVGTGHDSVAGRRDGWDDASGPVAPGPNTIAFDDHDGGPATGIRARGVSLTRCRPGEKSDRTVLEGADLKISLFVTAFRVALACSKYDTGGGWRGDPVSMVVLKTVAAVRTRNKSLVGHVRFPWLQAVGFVEKSGWLSDETIRLVFAGKAGASGGQRYYLDIALPKNESARRLAERIVRAAATYRLASDHLDVAQRSELDALVQPPHLAAEKKAFVFWVVPGARLAGPATAFVESGNSSESAASAGADLGTPPPPVIEAPTAPVVRGAVVLDEKDLNRATISRVSLGRTEPEATSLLSPPAPFALRFADGTTREFVRTVIVGRNPIRPAEFHDAELVPVSDVSVSKTHVAIGHTGDQLWVLDYHSTNGVLIQSEYGSDLASPGWPASVDGGVTVVAGIDTRFVVALSNASPIPQP